MDVILKVNRVYTFINLDEKTTSSVNVHTGRRSRKLSVVQCHSGDDQLCMHAYYYDNMNESSVQKLLSFVELSKEDKYTVFFFSHLVHSAEVDLQRFTVSVDV